MVSQDGYIIPGERQPLFLWTDGWILSGRFLTLRVRATLSKESSRVLATVKSLTDSGTKLLDRAGEI